MNERHHPKLAEELRTLAPDVPAADLEPPPSGTEPEAAEPEFEVELADADALELATPWNGLGAPLLAELYLEDVGLPVELEEDLSNAPVEERLR